MKTSFKNIVSCLLAGCMALPVAAQELRTSYFMQTSNFRHQMNPALLDKPYIGTLLSNVNVGTTGNVGLANFIYKLEGNPRYDLTTFMSPTVSASEFLGDLNDKNRIDVYLNYNLFSVGFNMLKGVSLLEVNLRSNTNLCLPKELFEFAKCAGAKEHYQLQDIGLRSSNYLELAFGHARNINDKLRVGAKFKVLLGGAYSDLTAEKLDLTMNGDKWIIEGNAQLKASVLKSDVTVDYDKKPSADGRYRVDELDNVSFGIPGKGFAVDFGATYQFNEDWTFSAAVTDLGFMNWKDTHHASSQGLYEFDGFDHPIYAGGTNTGKNEIGDQFDQMGKDLEDMFSLYYDGKKSSSNALATTINLGAEYTFPLYRKLRFGALYTSRINGKYSWHQGMISANVRPLNFIEVAVNTACSSTGITFGGVLSLNAKHFNFYLGADRFLGKTSKEFIPLHSANANINLGMTFPL